MKTIRLIISGFLTFIFFNLNAQVFIGGDLGFNSSGGSVDNGAISTDKPTTISFNFSPMIGKFLSDNFALGAALNFALSSSKTAGSPEITNTSSTFGITPFLRYYAVRMDKFSIFGQGNIGFSSSTSKTKSNGITADGPKTTTFSFDIVPGLSYDLSSRLALETTINILNVGFTDTVIKTGPVTDKTTSFRAGAGLNNILNVGSISIGAIFKF